MRREHEREEETEGKKDKEKETGEKNIEKRGNKESVWILRGLKGGRGIQSSDVTLQHLPGKGLYQCLMLDFIHRCRTSTLFF